MAAYNYVRPMNAGGPGNPGGIYNVSPGQFNSGTQGYSNPAPMPPQNDQEFALQQMFGDNAGMYQQLMQRFSQGRRPNLNQGQDPSLGRYRPPTMGGPAQGGWRDNGGYSYNLPNAYGARRFGGEGFRPNSQAGGWRDMAGDYENGPRGGNSSNGYQPTSYNGGNRPAQAGLNPDGTYAYGPQVGRGQVPAGPTPYGVIPGAAGPGGPPVAPTWGYAEPMEPTPYIPKPGSDGGSSGYDSSRYNAGTPGGNIGLPPQPIWDTTGEGDTSGSGGFGGHRSMGRGNVAMGVAATGGPRLRMGSWPRWLGG